MWWVETRDVIIQKQMQPWRALLVREATWSTHGAPLFECILGSKFEVEVEFCIKGRCWVVKQIRPRGGR